MTMGTLAPIGNRTLLFSSPVSHMALSVHFAYPTRVPFSSMRRIFMPFSHELWLITSASIICMMFLFCLNKKFSTPRDHFFDSNKDYEASIFNVMGTFLGLPSTERTLGHNTMLGLIMWLLATFVLRNVYLGSLFNLLTGQVNEEPVDTIEKLIQHNYTVHCTPATHELLFKNIPRIRKQ